MNVLPILLIGFGFSPVPLQENEDPLLGLAPAAVVKFSRKGWMDYYCGKVGGFSTVSMANAEQGYGTALARLNDPKIAKLATNQRAFYGRLRKDLMKFGADAHQIGEAIAGGGTIWINYNSTILPDVEQLIFDFLAGKPKSSGPVGALAEFSKVRRAIAKNAKFMDEFGSVPAMKSKGALTTLSGLSTQYRAIQVLMKLRTSAEKTRVERFLTRKLKVAGGGE